MLFRFKQFYRVRLRVQDLKEFKNMDAPKTFSLAKVSQQPHGSTIQALGHMVHEHKNVLLLLPYALINTHDNGGYIWLISKQ